MNYDVPVAISGAGPVGLSLGLGLARLGVRSVIFEKEAELPPHSRAGAVWQRSVEIFHTWGMLDELKAQGIVAKTIDPTDVDANRTIFSLDFSPLAGETLEPYPVFVPQDRTEAVLFAALARTRLCEVRFRHEILGLTQDADAVTLRVRDESGTESDVRAAFAAGADGAHSAVRAALGLSLDGKTYPLRVMLADVELDDARNDLPWPRFSFHRKEGFAGILHFGRGLWRIISPIGPDAADDVALAEEAIGKLVHLLLGPGPFNYVWGSTFQIHARRAKRFVVGRAILAGDAAHLNSPAGGQGMNTGIADAHNLAWKLASILRGEGDAATLLASYEEERLGVFASVVERNTDAITRVLLLSPENLRPLLIRIAGLLVSLPFLRKTILMTASMLGQRYARSPILCGQGAVLGSRSPDSELACGGPATLVLHRMPPEFAGASEAALKVKTRMIDARAARRWRMRGPFAALVRPDGYVGWIAHDPSAGEIDRGVRTALGRR
jgi:2-polyprenyl-6-methoxyphenol hydroxylase-like FAD-dependent oxidoreductase